MWRPLFILSLVSGGIELIPDARAQSPVPPPASSEENTAPASPAETKVPAPEPPATATPREELDVAIALFLEGSSSAARDRLRALLARGPELEAEVRLDALAYLGDILLTEEGPPAARGTFEALLDEDLEYRMDPIKHPPEVASYFEELRVARRFAQAAPALPVPTLVREPFPALAVLPLGVHWFVKKKPATGILIGGLQAAALATNIALYTQVQNTYDNEFVEAGSPEEAAYIRAEVGANVAAAVAWGSWLLPASIEIGRWATAPRVTVTPTVGGVAVSGTF